MILITVTFIITISIIMMLIGFTMIVIAIAKIQYIDSLVVRIPIRLVRTAVRMAEGKALKSVRTEKMPTAVTYQRIVLFRVIFYICIAEIDSSSCSNTPSCHI